MKLKTGVYIYLLVVASGILANFVLWRYRLHLYVLNSDYSREPLRSVQMVLFRGTEGLSSRDCCCSPGGRLLGGRVRNNPLAEFQLSRGISQNLHRLRHIPMRRLHPESRIRQPLPYLIRDHTDRWWPPVHPKAMVR
jgi:hypothetical protein